MQDDKIVRRFLLAKTRYGQPSDLLVGSLIGMFVRMYR
jgi:hypothetical protein